MASDPSDDYKSGPAMGQWTTPFEPEKEAKDDGETSIIWKSMYSLNGIDKIISLSGLNNGEWFQFKESGYYKIDLTVGLRVAKNADSGWVTIKDNGNKEIKAYAIAGKGLAATCGGSFLVKADKNYSIKLDYMNCSLRTAMNNKWRTGVLNTLLITKLN